MDQFISENKLMWVPYNKFENVEYLDKGGFSTIYKAIWLINKNNLRRCLTKIVKSNWKQKLYMLYKIIAGLKEIHRQDLIHCDFHDGNILNHKEDDIFISDLGLCRPIQSSLGKDNIYGVVPF